MFEIACRWNSIDSHTHDILDSSFDPTPKLQPSQLQGESEWSYIISALSEISTGDHCARSILECILLINVEKVVQLKLLDQYKYEFSYWKCPAPGYYF